jgi:putative membrane protein
MNTTDRQAQVISFLRLPLVVLVLFVHSNFHGISTAWDALWVSSTNHIGPQLPTLGAIIDFLSGSLALLANPFFFFISGLLFFREGLFTKELYIHKSQRRVFSLLIPYLFWNLTYLFLLSLGEGLLPNWTAIIDTPIEQFGFKDWLLAFWDISKINNQGGLTAPVVLPFWFIRDLMVLCVATPLIYKLIDAIAKFKIQVAVLLFLGLLLASKWVDDLPGLSFQGFLFFSFGAYFSIKQIKITEVMPRFQWFALFFVIFAWQQDFMNIAYAGLIIFVVSITTRYLNHRQNQGKITQPIPEILTNATFFVFAFHTIVQGGIIFLFKQGILSPHNALEGAVLYLLSPLTMLIVSVAIHYVLDKLSPRIMTIFCGGR